jgi:hypothetical protein
MSEAMREISVDMVIADDEEGDNEDNDSDSEGFIEEQRDVALGSIISEN